MQSYCPNSKHYLVKSHCAFEEAPYAFQIVDLPSNGIGLAAVIGEVHLEQGRKSRLALKRGRRLDAGDQLERDDVLAAGHPHAEDQLFIGDNHGAAAAQAYAL